MALDVLKGVSCPDHRSTLIDLNQQGWDIEKTNNGHLKLTHAEAKKPVFSGTTVSDFRARKNLISQCKNAIKLSRATRSDAAETKPMSEADVRKVLASHKFAKKTKGRRVAFDRYNPCSVDSGCSEDMSRMKSSHMRSGTSIPASAVSMPPAAARNSKQSARDQAEALFAKKAPTDACAQASATAKSPVKPEAQPTEPVLASDQPAKAQLPEVVDNHVAPAKPEATAVQKAVQKSPTSEIMNEEMTLELTTIDRTNASKVTPVKPRKAAKHAAPKAARKPVPAMTPISADVLALAQKIASGDYAHVQITPEMVGATLLFNGEMMITEGRTATAPGALVPDIAPEAGQAEVVTLETEMDAGVKPNGKVDKINTKLIAAIRDFAPESVTQKDLSELLFEEIGYKSVASALASISKRLTYLCGIGLVMEEKKGRLRAFRVKT